MVDLNFENDFSVSFASAEKNKNNFAVLELPNGSQIVILPQSQVSIEQAKPIS
jgi:hypothetical protein